MYSDEDVERLILLKRVVASGRSIGRIARLSDQELLDLVEPAAVRDHGAPQQLRATFDMSVHDCYRACADAVDRLDPSSLEESLHRCSIIHGHMIVIEELIDPLMRDIGKQWSCGKIRVLHEHMASAVIRTYLGNIMSSLDVSDSAPHVVSTTPAGEPHEIGALTAAVAAAMEGWKAIYLGPNLPAEDIIRAADLSHVLAVMLSVTMVPEQSRILSEIRKLRAYLKPDVAVLIGGRIPDRQQKLIERPGVRLIESLGELRTQLPLIQSGQLPSHNEESTQ
jgi:methanogenic corrinoid protein MtbC1